MASRDFNLLDPTFRDKLLAGLKDCKAAQIDVLVYCTLRTVEEQARLFRSSHNKLEVGHKIDSLNARGLGFLATVLQDIGPQPDGLHVTDAGPGESYHNYGLAADMVIMSQGKPDWAGKDPRWPQLGLIMAHHGLTWGASWGDSPHFQLGTQPNPTTGLTAQEVRKMLDAAFARNVE